MKNQYAKTPTKPINFALCLLLVLTLANIIKADTYSTFETTDYFSANRRYSLNLTPEKTATFYKIGAVKQKIWSAKLPHLPSRLFISNDGTRIVMVDHYYGNNGSENKIIVFLNKNGKEIRSYLLAELADLKRVLRKTSSSDWYYGAFFRPEHNEFVVETVVRKCEGPNGNISSVAGLQLARDCFQSTPFEEIVFSTETGTLLSRSSIQSKYQDEETRLLHELKLVEADQPQNDLGLSDAILALADFYKNKRRFEEAMIFFERALPIYAKVLGEDFSSVGAAFGKAATTHRELGNFKKAETYYLKALYSLDKGQGDLNNAYPQAVEVYADYAVALRSRNRNEDAARMDKRADLIRKAYPSRK